MRNRWLAEDDKRPEDSQPRTEFIHPGRRQHQWPLGKWSASFAWRYLCLEMGQNRAQRPELPGGVVH